MRQEQEAEAPAEKWLQVTRPAKDCVTALKVKLDKEDLKVV